MKNTKLPLALTMATLFVLSGCKETHYPTDGVLTDQSESLDAVLEYGMIRGACDRYRDAGEEATEYQMLMCGKEMFFFEHFNFSAVPKPIILFMQKNFPNTVGRGNTAFGLYEDPYDPDGMPIGLADSPPVPGTNDTTSNWTCASCHFAQNADGMWVVGQANVNFEYGKQLLAITAVMPVLVGFVNKSTIPENAMEIIQPILDEWKSNPNWISLMFTGLKLLDHNIATVTNLTPEQQWAFASWKAGVQDPLLFPNETNDGAHIPLKIPNAYNIPSPDQFAELGLDPSTHARIGWAGNTASTDEFIQFFAALGTDDPANWTGDRIEPLKQYLLSLKPPASPYSPDEESVAWGEELFYEKGCIDCHNGPGYMGTELYDFDELGTDDTLQWIFDGDRDYGLPTPNLIESNPMTLEHKMKAPALTGLWTQDKFLHNGSVDSLEDLFCMNHTRPTITDAPFSDAGHMYTCDELNIEEKQALMNFMITL